MAFELFLADHRMGALNVFAERPHAFDGASREIGLIFATHSAIAWNAIRRDEQFRQALASRDIIGQAKGMIMERYGIGALQAFEMLKKLSQDGNIPIVDLSRQMVENTHPATEEA